MSMLPDEIWSKILEMGVGSPSSRLGYRDLCCIAIACRRLNRLSGDAALWSTLLSLDFPNQTLTPSTTTTSSSPKSIYKTRFEKEREKRLLAWRREVLYAESKAAVFRMCIRDLESQMSKESEKLIVAAEELNNLDRIRRASAALNIWQPEVVRERQTQIVGQCTVPLKYRLSVLKMEVDVCKQNIATFKKAHSDQKRKLSECEEALKSLKYQPLQSYRTSATGSDYNVKRRKKEQSCEGSMQPYLCKWRSCISNLASQLLVHNSAILLLLPGSPSSLF